MKSAELSPEQGRALYIASGSTHPELAVATAEAMGLKLGALEHKQFPDTELYVRYGESVRGDHVFAFQTHAARPEHSINDSIQELLLMVDAAKRASAREITAVIPHFAYSRQDRKAKGREPISAAVVAKQLAVVGADRIVSVDLHSPQTQATFDGPFDHLTAEPLLRKQLKKRIKGDREGFVIVAPDSGRAKTAEHYSQALKIDVVNMSKSRDKKDSSKIVRPHKVDEVDGKICFLIDDMIDTAGTLVSAAETLRNSGAVKVFAAATHGLFSDPAIERIKNAPIDEVLVTDTVPMNIAQTELGDKLKVISIATLVGKALTQIAIHGSVSEIFHDQNYM